MDLETGQYLFEGWGETLGEIAHGLRDLVEVGKNSQTASEMIAAKSALHVVSLETRIKDLEKFRQDTLCWSGHIKAQLDAIRERFERLDLAAETVGQMTSRVQGLEANGLEFQANTVVLQEQNGRTIARVEAIEKKVRELTSDEIAIKIEDIESRLEANEQTVQSCLSTLGEVNKVVQAIAKRMPGATTSVLQIDDK